MAQNRTKNRSPNFNLIQLVTIIVLKVGRLSHRHNIRYISPQYSPEKSESAKPRAGFTSCVFREIKAILTPRHQCITPEHGKTLIESLMRKVDVRKAQRCEVTIDGETHTVTS